MASIIMHMAVADELYKKIKSKLEINYYNYILGTIAPDISKTIGLDKKYSHFSDNSLDIPNIDIFLKKYQKTLNNSFNLGYFIHLYTDKLFYQDYYPLFIQDKFITANIRCLNGEEINVSLDDRKKLLYNDYTNLNIQLIDEYNINLDIFFNEFIPPKTNIDEIPIDKLNVLIESAGIIIQNTKKTKEYIINISSVKAFVDDCVEELYTKLLELNIIE